MLFHKMAVFQKQQESKSQCICLCDSLLVFCLLMSSVVRDAKKQMLRQHSICKRFIAKTPVREK